MPEAPGRSLPRVLDLAARSAFHVARLEPVPGWYFGQWDRNDPRAWIRRSIWRLAHSRGYDGPVTTDWYSGLRFQHHLTGDISQCTYVDGRYEPNEMYAMSGLLKAGMTMIDVGANAGIFTLMAAALVGPSGAVHSFEPSPRDLERLRANVNLNHLANVAVHGEALGRRTAKAMLTVSAAARPGHNTMGDLPYEDDAGAGSVEVNVTTLDDFARTAGLTQMDLLKIDVEGSETAVIEGGRESLRKFRPAIVLEANEAALRKLGSSVTEMLRLVRELGYAVNVFGPSGRPEPVGGDRLSGENLLCLPA